MILRNSINFLNSLDVKRKLLLIISIVFSILKTFNDLIIISYLGFVIAFTINPNIINNINFFSLRFSDLIIFDHQGLILFAFLLITIKIFIDFFRAYFVNFSAYDYWIYLNKNILRNIDKKCIPKESLLSIESTILSETVDFINTLYLPLCSFLGELFLIIFFIVFLTSTTNLSINIVLISFIPILFIFYLIFISGKKRLQLYVEKSIFFRKIIGRKINLLLNSLPDLQLLNKNFFSTEFNFQLNLLKKSYFNIFFLKEIFSYFYENIFILFLIIFLIATSINTITEYFSISIIVLIIVALVRIGPALNRIMIGINNIFQGILKFQEISQYLNIKKNNNIVKLSLNQTDLTLKITGKGFYFLNSIHINNLYIFRKGINKIIGKNGSGKSTILNILMNIDYGFKVKTNIASKNIAYLNQTPINYCRIVRDEIMFSRKTLLIKNDHNYIKNYKIIKSLLQINKIKLNSVIDNLSGGQRQVVSICRIIMQNFTVLLLDEPFNSLDKKNVIIFSKIFKNISKEKIIVLIDHFNILKEDFLIKLN